MSKFTTRATVTLTGGRVDLEVTVRHKGGWVGTGVAANLYKGGVHSTSGVYDIYPTLDLALLSVAEKWGHGTLALDTITVKSSGSPLTGKSLKELVTAAWREVLRA